MPYLFKKHFTVQEARGLLPRIRQWLHELDQVRHRLNHFDQRFGNLLSGGSDLGGESVNEWVKAIARFKELAGEFEKRHIQIKDLERGLIDFPSLMDGKEIFLCWERDDDDIEYWHDLDSGFAGRERLK